MEVELKEVALREGIVFNKALDFGVRFLLAEKDRTYNYPPTKLQEKLFSVIEKMKEEKEEENKPIFRDIEVENDKDQ